MSIINCLLLAVLFPLFVYAEDATTTTTEQPPVGQIADQSAGALGDQATDSPVGQVIDGNTGQVNEEESVDDIPVVQLSPQIRREPLEKIKPYTIPLHEIQPWLNRLRVMDKQDLNYAPNFTAQYFPHLVNAQHRLHGLYPSLS